MRRTLQSIFLLGALCVPILHATHEAATFSHSAWDHVLHSFILEDGRINYEAMLADPAELNRYIRLIALSSPENRPDLFSSEAHSLAYWLNAYNALTLKGIVEQYPVESIRDLGMFERSFRNQEHVVGGRKMSLNYIEHAILRGRYSDPRVHFAITYGAVSSPRLFRQPFYGDILDQQLTQVTRRFLREEQGIAIDVSQNRITLNAIFHWYDDDFRTVGRGWGPKALLDFIGRYADADTRRTLQRMEDPKVSCSEFDWTVNAADTSGGTALSS